MGAWNYGVFDDDTAYDALIDLKGSSDIIADMEQYFDEVIQAEYIGYDEAHYALVSAAVIDSVINSFVYRCDEEDYFEWTSSQPIYCKKTNSEMTQDKKTSLFILKNDQLEDGKIDLQLISSVAMMENYLMDVNYMFDYEKLSEYCMKYWMGK